MTQATRNLWALLFFISLLAAVLYLLPARDFAVDLIDRIRSYGAVAPVVFFFIYLLACICGFSRSALAILAGIIFEPLTAFITVTVSSMIGFMSTFWLARYFVADLVAARLAGIPTAGKLMVAVERFGFRMLMLMRMNPFVPGFVNGYGFGLTSIRALPYFTASLIGTLPLNLIYIYLGWAGGKAVLLDGAAAEALNRGTLLFGAVVSLLTLIAIGWYGRRVMASIDATLAPHNNTS